MAQKRVTATAKVTVVIEVELQATWGPDATIGGLHEMAAREACDVVERTLRSKTETQHTTRIMREASMATLTIRES